jgi:hypothetical protein
VFDFVEVTSQLVGRLLEFAQLSRQPQALGRRFLLRS